MRVTTRVQCDEWCCCCRRVCAVGVIGQIDRPWIAIWLITCSLFGVCRREQAVGRTTIGQTPGGAYIWRVGDTHRHHRTRGVVCEAHDRGLNRCLIATRVTTDRDVRIVLAVLTWAFNTQVDRIGRLRTTHEGHGRARGRSMRRWLITDQRGDRGGGAEVAELDAHRTCAIGYREAVLTQHYSHRGRRGRCHRRIRRVVCRDHDTVDPRLARVLRSVLIKIVEYRSAYCIRQ